MRTLFALLLLAFAALGSPAAADEEYDACIEKGITDPDYRECGSLYLQRADADLNAAWRELREVASDETRKWLLEEQRAWNSYKEKACLFWGTGEYGTMGSVLSFPPCLGAVIEKRTAELRDYREALRDP